MTKQNIPQPAGNGQQSHNILSPIPRSEQLTPRAALTIGARAVEYLLTGEPHSVTFDPADLEQAAVLLRQMVETMRPVLTGNISSQPGGEEAL
jgi:hypothetical protein